VALADRTDMSSGGKFYFYASHPSIDTAEKFNKQCDRAEESVAILGCYDGQNIYIYDITDSRLDGIREVTAAHEMLHAAYARLNEDEKQKVNVLLEAEYAKLKDTAEFAERMSFYARSEPGERDNELHSIIGTEVKTIGVELEAHYRRYFNDRSKIVGLHEAYASVFAALQSRSKQLGVTLTALGNEIEADSSSYNTAVTQLNADINTFNARANNGGFGSVSEFESARAKLVARANQLEEERASINDKVARYDVIRQELTSVASESEALSRSIDSSLAPAPSL
jgi:chromosome segregation ATPase